MCMMRHSARAGTADYEDWLAGGDQLSALRAAEAPADSDGGAVSGEDIMDAAAPARPEAGDDEVRTIMHYISHGAVCTLA